MIARRSLGALVALGLFVASCASHDENSYETADRILEAAGAGPSSFDESAVQTVGDECETELREDEYGFMFEVCVDVGTSQQESRDQPVQPDVQQTPNDGRSLPIEFLSLDRFDQLVSAMPAGDASDELVALGAELDSMDEACASSSEIWLTSLGSVTRQVRVAAGSVLGDPRLDDYRRQTEAVELADVIVERAVMQTGCAVSPISATIIEDDALLPATARLSAAVESLFEALWNGEQVSPYFSHVDELAHWMWMREEESIDVVIAGTSQTLLGVEPDLVQQSIGQSVGNVSLPGALAETQQYWLPRVVYTAHPKTIVWGIGPLDLLGVCPSDGRGEGFRSLMDLKDAGFARVPAARSARGIDLILGPVGANDYADTLMVDDIAQRFVGPRGDVFEFTGTDSEQLATTLEQSSPPFEEGTRCDERLAVIAEVLDDLRRAGVEVVVFGMPVAASLAARYPGGDTALDRLVDDAAAEVFEPAGATYVGMMQSIDDDALWYDVVHPTKEGGIALSQELADALIEIGI